MGADIILAIAKPAHVDALALELRPEDAAEAVAMGYPDGLTALRESFGTSEVAWAALVHERIAAMFGVIRSEAGGVLWLATGAAFAKHPLALARTARRVLRLLLQQYGTLRNHIDASHPAALRFARLLGAEVGQPEPVGPSGQLFCPYTFGGR